MLPMDENRVVSSLTFDELFLAHILTQLFFFPLFCFEACHSPNAVSLHPLMF